MNNIETGRMGEEIAAYFLRKKGYYIIEKNYRTNFGEIDLIASKGEFIVFVEVKARANILHGYPAEAVDSRKMNKIRNTANFYICQNNFTSSDFRFDVVEIYLNNRKINHIENAF